MRKQWMPVIGAIAILVVAAATTAAAKPSGATGRQLVLQTVTLTPPEGSDIISLNEVASCPQGTASVNGGWAWVTPPAGQDTLRRVAGGPQEANWRVVAGPLLVPEGSSNDFTLWAICVNA